MSDRRTLVVTSYGHDKTIDKISVSSFENNCYEKHTSDAKEYCETINSLELTGNSWVSAKIISENVQYEVNELFPLKIDVLSNLDDRSIQKVLREIDTQDLSMALKGEETLQKKIFGNLSHRAAQMLKEDMEYMGSVRIREVKAAQEKILNVICRLEEAGEIIVGYGGTVE